jgi:arylsulfatase A-like enzyme
MQEDAAPRFDPAFATFIEDMDRIGLLEDTLVVAVGEFGRSPRRGLSTSGNDNDADGRDHWPYCFTAAVAGAGVRRGHVHGRSDATGSAPLEAPVHPTDLLATIYHALGIDPATIVFNHLDQPRELVKGAAVTELFA